jgi:PAS domain S-box-containing protein
MDATLLAAVFSGVTSLALGLAFAYLWRFVLPKRYVALFAAARLVAVPQVGFLLLQVRYHDFARAGAVVALLSALSSVCFIAGCFGLLGRRLALTPLVLLGVALAGWGIAGPHLTQSALLQEYPDSLVRGGLFLVVAWLLQRGERRAGRRPLAWLLIAAGLHELDYPLLVNRAWGFGVGLALAEFTGIAVSVFLLITMLEEARRSARLAGAALRESEERFRAIVDLAPIGIAVIDAEGQYLHVNPGLQHLLGYTEAELRQRRFQDITAPEDVEPTDRPFREMVQGRRDHFRAEKRYLRKDGSEVWARLIATAVRDDAGRFVHTISLVEDVTDEQRRTAAARENEERLRQNQAALVRLARHPTFTAGEVAAVWRELTESAARTLEVERASVWLADADHARIRASDLYERSPRRHSGGLELTAAHCPAYFQALEHDRVIAATDARADPRTRELTSSYLAPHGITSLLDAPIRAGGRTIGVVCVEHTGPPRDWSPAAQGFAGSIADLAALALESRDRAEAEDAARRSHSLLEATIEATGDGILVVDRDNRIERYNRRFVGMWGLPEHTLISAEAAIAAAREQLRDPEAFARQIDYARSHPEDPSHDVLEFKDGRVFERQSWPRRLGSEIVGRVWSFRDVTEQELAEVALRLSEDKFATAFRLSPTLMVIARLGDGQIVDVNDAFSAATGFPRAEVLGQSTRDVLWPDPAARAGLVEQLQTTGRVRDLELKMRTKAGPVLDVLVSIETITIDGQPHTLGAAVDITERKRVTVALAKSEEKFAKAFRASPNAIVISRLADGVVVDANETFFAVTGYAREEAVGRSTLDLIWPDGAQRDALVATIRREGRVRGVELRMRTKSNDVMEGLVSIEVIELDGAPHLLVEALDITERNRAEAALRTSEERFRLVTLATNDAVYDWDVPSDRLWWSDALKRMFGHPTEAALTQTGWWSGQVHPEDLERVRASLAAATARRREVWSEEYRFRRSDGTYADVLDRGYYVYAEDGRPLRMIGSMADISERKTAERHQAHLQEAVMASAVDWTMTFDAVPSPLLILGGNGRVRRLNAAARALAGKDSYRDAVGKSLESLAPGEPWRSLASLAAEVSRTRLPATGQAHERGPRRSWYLTANPISVAGEDDRIIVIARDITDLVALQESLRRTETMSVLGSLVAGVAHEVRNPLFAISATVDAFEARFAQDQYTRYTQTLREQVGRLSELMRELLEYGKPPGLDLVEAGLGPIVERAAQDCRQAAEDAGVVIAPSLGDGLPPVRVDGSRMHQVFLNLIENAVQHSPRGATVTVRAAVVRRDAARRLEVSIIDQGPGFREEDLPHIFEPFFTRRRGGTGLGLSIVQRIVEQHGGEILARNGPTGGAIMTIQLALSEPPRVEA